MASKFIIELNASYSSKISQSLHYNVWLNQFDMQTFFIEFWDLKVVLKNHPNKRDSVHSAWFITGGVIKCHSFGLLKSIVMHEIHIGTHNVSHKIWNCSHFRCYNRQNLYHNFYDLDGSSCWSFNITLIFVTQVVSHSLTIVSRIVSLGY